MRRSIWIALFASAAFATWSLGRQIETWSYDRLFKEAGLVVIARAQETVDTDAKAKDDRWTASLVGQKTTFKIEAVLKGKAPDMPLTVRHFRVKKDVLLEDGPLLIAFRTKGPVIHGRGAAVYEAGLGTPEYLLFLKPDSKGSFEPVSGEIDPQLSVKETYSPLPSVIDEK